MHPLDQQIADARAQREALEHLAKSGDLTARLAVAKLDQSQAAFLSAWSDVIFNGVAESHPDDISLLAGT